MDIEIKKILDDHEKRMSRIENVLAELNKRNKKLVSKKKLSIKEFILSKNPVDDNQKTLCIGYYFEHFDNLPSFHSKDLKKGFGLAKESTPENINDRINKNIRKGFMMEAEEKKDNRKAFSLTNKGEKFVENSFKE